MHWKNVMKDKFIQAFMDVAERFAQLSVAKRANVGCVIVKDNRILGYGYNGTPSGWDNECEVDGVTKPEVLHAEANGLMKIAQSNESSKDAVMFCTHEPCIECAKLIHQAGIRTVYYREIYDAAKGTGREFLKKSGIGLTQVSKDG